MKLKNIDTAIQYKNKLDFIEKQTGVIERNFKQLSTQEMTLYGETVKIKIPNYLNLCNNILEITLKKLKQEKEKTLIKISKLK